MGWNVECVVFFCVFNERWLYLRPKAKTGKISETQSGFGMAFLRRTVFIYRDSYMYTKLAIQISVIGQMFISVSLKLDYVGRENVIKYEEWTRQI